MTDNIAILKGYTEEYHADNGQYTLYLLVKPDTDFDSTFKAWDMDEQEWVNVNGWLFCFEHLG